MRSIVPHTSTISLTAIFTALFILYQPLGWNKIFHLCVWQGEVGKGAWGEFTFASFLSLLPLLANSSPKSTRLMIYVALQQLYLIPLKMCLHMTFYIEELFICVLRELWYSSARQRVWSYLFCLTLCCLWHSSGSRKLHKQYFSAVSTALHRSNPEKR